RGLRHDLDAGLEHILVLGQREPRLPAPEQAREVLLEARADGLEGLAEALAAGAVDALDRVAELGDAGFEVRLLLREEAEALAQLLVLLDRAQVHFAERLERGPRLVEAGAAAGAVQGQRLGLRARRVRGFARLGLLALGLAGAGRGRVLGGRLA